MRKVITGAMLSLDGVMQAPGGPKEDPTRGFKLGGWVVPYAESVVQVPSAGMRCDARGDLRMTHDDHAENRAVRHQPELQPTGSSRGKEHIDLGCCRLEVPKE
jgi:hypothetical protein